MKHDFNVLEIKSEECLRFGPQQKIFLIPSPNVFVLSVPDRQRTSYIVWRTTERVTIKQLFLGGLDSE